MSKNKTLLLLLSVAILSVGGCSERNGSGTIHLVDHFDPATVAGGPASNESDLAPLWDFAASDIDGTQGWTAGPGVADLRVEDGLLKGRTTTDSPILYRKDTSMPKGEDLYAIELLISVNRDGVTSVQMEGPWIDVEQFAERMLGVPWYVSRPVQASGDVEAVSLLWTGASTATQTMLIRPADTAGVEFEIASIDLVSQRKHRASTPTGIEWQGLGQVFRESIASRSPESFTVSLDVAPNSWLDLHVGTIEESPVTFLIEDLTAASPHALLKRTVTTSNRWDAAPIELEPGFRDLRFTITGERDLLTGFWGSPTVRVRGAEPQTVKAAAPALGNVTPPLGVIVLLTDTLRRDHLSVYGYDRETDPNLVRMAAAGVTFLDNISPATWTIASTPSILTSLYPISHRVHQYTHRLSAVAKTLAEVYREAGYATVSYPTNHSAGRATNLHQGFEELHESTSFDASTGSKTAREATDRALDWIERHAESPFFVYLHVLDPHSPFEPYPPYDSIWADPANKEEHERQRDASLKFIEWAPGRGLPNKQEAIQAGLDPQEWIEHEQAWYDGSIRGGDAELGRILERLEVLGLREKVAVAFISDHGEEFYEHGRMWHGQHAYGELANVPLVISYPPLLPMGLKIKQTVRSIDLMPTLLDLSGLEAPPEAQGQSLIPLIAAANGRSSGEESELLNAARDLGWLPLAAVTEKARTIGGGPPPRQREAYGLVKDGWKLVHNVEDDDGADEFELFNHREDPLNLKNVAAANPTIVEDLKSELAAWRNMVEQGQLPQGDAAEDLTPEEVNRLRSLGYIQ